MINVQQIKKDFPIFTKNPDLVYLDSAAMALKPQSVINAVSEYYQEYSANVFRGVYKISEKATEAYEDTRKKVAKFINAKSEKEIIFVRNTTEAINLVAYSWGRINIERDSEIVTTVMEHHSNFVPWQVLAGENNAVLKVVDITNEGLLDLEQNNLINNLEKIITKKTKILAIAYVSNALGTINPVKEVIQAAKKINPKIKTLVDAAQAVPHMPVDVQNLGCDFLAFSGQKILGPTGAGVLWAKQEILEEMPPFLYGGEMIREVHLNETKFAGLPHKFEAGTPHIAGVIGLGAVIDYISKIGMENIRIHERQLTQYALKELIKIKGLKIYGSKDVNHRSGVIIFNLGEIHSHDVSQILDEYNICVRSGHHCAMPLHERLGLLASVRATFYIYNNKKDINKLIEGIEKVRKLLL